MVLAMTLVVVVNLCGYSSLMISDAASEIMDYTSAFDSFRSTEH
jgi:hypothetical protein